MERKVIFVFECPYCQSFLDKPNSPHCCFNEEAPDGLKEGPDSAFQDFLELLRNSDFVFVFRYRENC